MSRYQMRQTLFFYTGNNNVTGDVPFASFAVFTACVWESYSFRQLTLFGLFFLSFIPTDMVRHLNITIM